jgi:hypothetical protein
MAEVTPSNTAVAVIVTPTPTAFAVTNPVASTDAMAGLLEDHVMVRPRTTALDASLHVAVS